MSYIYFQSGDVQFVMDSYSSVSAPLTGQLSGSPMQSGTEQSDNYVVGIPVVTMSGIITDIKTARSRDTKSTGSWIARIRDIMNNKQSVLLQYQVDIEPSDGWFITSFNPSQDQTNGVGARRPDGTFVQSFRIDIEFKRPILARGLISTVQPPQAYLDSLQAKGSKSTATSQFDKNKKKDEINYEYSFNNAKELRKFARSVDFNAPATE